MGDNFTYNAQRVLLSSQSLAKNITSAIFLLPATGTLNPGDSASPALNETYEKLHRNVFADWRLTVEAQCCCANSIPMADLQKISEPHQITRHTRRVGWMAIAQWTGVPLRHHLQSVGIKPSARFVNLHAYDGYGKIALIWLMPFTCNYFSLYGMNGKNLPVHHGAPLRIRVEKQIGYKA